MQRDSRQSLIEENERLRKHNEELLRLYREIKANHDMGAAWGVCRCELCKILITRLTDPAELGSLDT